MDKRKPTETAEQGEELVRYSPLGLFYLKEGVQYIGIDNSSGNAWTEEFSDLAACLMWLREGACPPFGG